ncbi:MAG: Fpg/Nei family DNA glycosylase [Acidimicrobiia bacterium]|nr:Fpg/Nei family DNA glycosylase [Acidimicrobiia bacterium]
MPEGDTLHRTAARLRPALVGASLEAFEAPRAVGPHPAVGSSIDEVAAVGKHLVVRFGDGVVLRTHLRMTGSWHLYRPHERWQRSSRAMRVRLEVPDWVAVCFSAPVVELRSAGSGPLPAVARLGPDLCQADADLAAAVERMGRVGEGNRSVAELLLDQRVMAGVGNVYKSEVLWACGVDPFRPIEAVPDAVRSELVATAHRLLRTNLRTARRTTVAGPAGSLAVYGRRGAPCRRCAAPVLMKVHGEQARSTYWCPACQR